MWRTNFRISLIATFLLGGGAVLVTVSWNHLLTHHRIDEKSEQTDGRVLDSSSSPLSKGGQTFTLCVEYQPRGHSAITKTFEVTSEEYKAATATGKTRVAYWPDDPQISRVSKFAILPFKVLTGLGAVMLVSGVMCLRLRWIPDRRGETRDQA